jgi:hypothetical protein
MNPTEPNVQLPVQAAEGRRARRPWAPPRLTHEAVRNTEGKPHNSPEKTHDGPAS